MVDYSPSQIPKTSNNLLDVYVEKELQSVSDDLKEITSFHYQKWAALPDKYTDGDQFYFAAGVVGLVAGLYLYSDGKWLPLVPYPAAAAAGGTMYSTTGVSVTFTANVDVKLTFDTQGAYDIDINIDLVNDQFVIERAGLYLVNGAVNFINPTPNTTWTIVIFLNGAAAPLTRMTYIAKDNNDPVAMRGILCGLLAVGDVLQLRMSCTTTKTATVSSRYFQLVQQQ